MKERRSNSLGARNAALSSSIRCLESICEDRRQEVRLLLRHLRACTNSETDHVAHQCDHYGIDGSKWWAAVKRARRLLKKYQPKGSAK